MRKEEKKYVCYSSSRDRILHSEGFDSSLGVEDKRYLYLAECALRYLYEGGPKNAAKKCGSLPGFVRMFLKAYAYFGDDWKSPFQFKISHNVDSSEYPFLSKNQIPLEEMYKKIGLAEIFPTYLQRNKKNKEDFKKDHWALIFQEQKNNGVLETYVSGGSDVYPNGENLGRRPFEYTTYRFDKTSGEYLDSTQTSFRGIIRPLLALPTLFLSGAVFKAIESGKRKSLDKEILKKVQKRWENNIR